MKISGALTLSQRTRRLQLGAHTYTVASQRSSAGCTEDIVGQGNPAGGRSLPCVKPLSARRTPEIPMSSPSSKPTASSQYHPDRHPEFGYFVPGESLRRKASLMGRGAIVGAILGIVAAGLLVMTARHAPISLFSLQLQAASHETLEGQAVPFLAPSLAVPAAANAAPPDPAAIRSGKTEAGTALAAPNVARVVAALAETAPLNAAPAEAAAPVQQPVQQKAKRKKKKVVRHPPRYRIVRRVEDDPRRAYAGPMPRYGEPYGRWGERRPFGYGW